jgi:hypothetical protein
VAQAAGFNNVFFKSLTKVEQRVLIMIFEWKWLANIVHLFNNGFANENQ